MTREIFLILFLSAAMAFGLAMALRHPRDGL